MVESHQATAGIAGVPSRPPSRAELTPGVHRDCGASTTAAMIAAMTSGSASDATGHSISFTRIMISTGKATRSTEATRRVGLYYGAEAALLTGHSGPSAVIAAAEAATRVREAAEKTKGAARRTARVSQMTRVRMRARMTRAVSRTGGNCANDIVFQQSIFLAGLFDSLWTTQGRIT